MRFFLLTCLLFFSFSLSAEVVCDCDYKIKFDKIKEFISMNIEDDKEVFFWVVSQKYPDTAKEIKCYPPGSTKLSYQEKYVLYASRICALEDVLLYIDSL